MAAFTKLADGTVLRWHYPALEECAEPGCTRRHATLDELNTFDGPVA